MCNDTTVVVPNETEVVQQPVVPARRRLPWWVWVPIVLVFASGAFAVWKYVLQIDTSKLPGRFICSMRARDPQPDTDTYAIYGMPANGHELLRILDCGRDVRFLPIKNMVMFAKKGDTLRESPGGYQLPPAQSWFLMQPDGSQVEQLGPEVTPFAWPSPQEFCQDGLPTMDVVNSRAAFALTGYETTEIMMVTPGMQITRLTGDGNPGHGGVTKGNAWKPREGRIYNTDPQFSPDGVHLLYLKHNSRNETSIHIIAVDEHIDRLLAAGEQPAFMPDGQSIVFTGADPKGAGATAVFRMGIDGHQQKLIAHDAECATPSPDGKYIAFLRNEHGNWSLHVVCADGTRATHIMKLPDKVQSMLWINK